MNMLLPRSSPNGGSGTGKHGCIADCDQHSTDCPGKRAASGSNSPECLIPVGLR